MTKKMQDRERAYSLGFTDGAVLTALDEVETQKKTLSGTFALALFLGPFGWGSIVYLTDKSIDGLIVPAVLFAMITLGYVIERNRLDTRSILLGKRKQLPTSVYKISSLSSQQLDW